MLVAVTVYIDPKVAAQLRLIIDMLSHRHGVKVRMRRAELSL